MMPGRWEAIEAKIGSGGNLITRAIIQKYGEFNLIDDLSMKVRGANPFIHRLSLGEYDIDSDTIKGDASISDMMHRFVPKQSDSFRWKLFITQLLRRTHLSGVVKSEWSSNSPLNQGTTHATNVNESINANEKLDEQKNGKDGNYGVERNEIQPCLPFFNGLIRSLVRSNEF